MNDRITPEPAGPSKGERNPWRRAAGAAAFAAFILLVLGMCCISPLINVVLPTPSCMGGIGAEHAEEARAVVMVDMVFLGAVFPVALLLAALLGLVTYFIFRSRWQNTSIMRLATAMGILVGLVAVVAVPVVVNGLICSM